MASTQRTRVAVRAVLCYSVVRYLCGLYLLRIPRARERAEISPITYGTVCLHVAFVFVCLFEGCSTETVLLRIVNDILFALDNDNISVLLLLDLSAAFDTLDHQILLSRLNSVFGIQLYCTPVVSFIPLRQVSVHFSQ